MDVLSCTICLHSVHPQQGPSIHTGCSCATYCHLSCLLSLLQAGGNRCPFCLSDFSEDVLLLSPCKPRQGHVPPNVINRSVQCDLSMEKTLQEQLKMTEEQTQKHKTSKEKVMLNKEKPRHKNQKLHRRLMREVEEIRAYASQEGGEPWLSVLFDTHSRQALVTFRGPEESLYSEGVFRLSLTFNEQHPLVPPVAKFLHQVFHPNVSLDGQTVDSVILKSLWSPLLSLTTIICHIRDMLGSTSLTCHGSPEPCDGPAGEVRGGLTRVVGGGKGGKDVTELNAEKEIQVWVVGAECAGLWLADPSTARRVTVQHTARSANHSLVWET